MAPRCHNPSCGYPDTPCFRRAEFPDILDCPDQSGAASTSGTIASTEPADALDARSPGSPAQVPPEPSPAASSPPRLWSGRALGTGDLFPILGDVPARVVLIVGREDAGKTCLLTAQFLAMAAGRAPGFPYRFAGSRTLRGWERLTDQAWEWSGKAADRVVPRSTQGSHREPGLLHLALKARLSPTSPHTRTAVRHLLCTDFPGEWTDAWVKSEAEGPRRFGLPRVDCTWALIDAHRLQSDRLAFRDIAELLRRVSSDPLTRDRPLALVLTQVDKVPDRPAPSEVRNPAAWGSIGKALSRLWARLDDHNGPTGFFAVSAFPGHPGEVGPSEVMGPLWFALANRPPQKGEPPPPPVGARYFSLFREAP